MSRKKRTPMNTESEETADFITGTSVVEDVAVEESIMEPEMSVEPPDEPAYGTVVGCTRLNIRKDPYGEAAILCSAENGEKLMVCMSESDDKWLSVYNELGAHGYCMSKYIRII